MEDKQKVRGTREVNTAIVNLKINQGDTFSRVFKLINTADGSVFDLDSYTVAMQARSEVDSSTTLITSSGGTPNITLTISVPNGTVTMLMTAIQTTALDFGIAVWDMEFTLGAIKTKFFRGTIVLNKEVTR